MVEPLGAEPLGEPLGGGVVGGTDGVVEGAVEDGGDADGMRSPGRSPTRSVRDSLQAVSSPKLSATAQRPVSILFMRSLLLVGVARTPPEVATHMPPSDVLTGLWTTITNAGDPPYPKR